MTLLFPYDLETTGLLPWKNAIHQIGFKIIIDGDIKEEVSLRCSPWDGAVLDKKAMEMAGLTAESIQDFPTHKETYNKLCSILEKYVDKFNKKQKFHLLGYNNRQFDDQFFRQFFYKNGDKYFNSYFWGDSIDVMILASDYLKDERSNMPDFKLHTVAKHLGIEVDSGRLHEAMYDLYLTEQIYLTVGKEIDNA